MRSHQFSASVVNYFYRQSPSTEGRCKQARVRWWLKWPSGVPVCAGTSFKHKCTTSSHEQTNLAKVEKVNHFCCFLFCFYFLVFRTVYTHSLPTLPLFGVHVFFLVFFFLSVSLSFCCLSCSSSALFTNHLIAVLSFMRWCCASASPVCVMVLLL